MNFLTNLLLTTLPILSISVPTTAATATAERTLYVSHYDGHIYTLGFNESDTNVNTSLTLTNTLEGCGSMPSWLELDTQILYCVDESGSLTSGNGSLNSYEVSDCGDLTEIASAETLAGGVASVIYEAAGGADKFIAIAHYEGSALSTFPLPLTNESEALQTFQFVLTGPVTVPDRQDAPHPHEVILDPTGKYILSPDLGADLIRIFAISDVDGTLTECTAFNTTPGNGPRHGAFYVDESIDTTMLYVTNELANDASVYSVSYASSNSSSSNNCLLSLTLQDQLTPSPSGSLPANSYVSEIHISPNTTDLYIAVRGDQSFAPDDSIAFLEIDSATGLLTPTNLTSSFGSYPRTFVISSDGEFVAIGNQDSSTVAIVKRDSETGELGDLLGNLEVGDASAGLSSVIWRD